MSEQEQEPQEQGGPEPDETPEEQPTPIQPPDEEEESEEEPSEEPPQGADEFEQPQARSEKDMENRWKRIAQSAKVWRKRIPEVFEGDVEMFAECPLCEPLVPGFVMLADETAQRFPAVRQFIGDVEPEDWQDAPDAERCHTCAGFGMVETGSRVQGQERLPCKTCDGRGWIGERAQTPTFPPPALAPPVENNGPATAFTIEAEPPEAAELRAKGYTLIPPVGS